MIVLLKFTKGMPISLDHLFSNDFLFKSPYIKSCPFKRDSSILIIFLKNVIKSLIKLESLLVNSITQW
jgi:hypothetical protein